MSFKERENQSLKKPKAQYEDTGGDEGFNDRVDSTQGYNPGDRAEFLAALRGAITETAGGGAAREEDWKSQAMDCVDYKTGALTSAFREELRLISEEQLSRLEVAASRTAAPDLFGLLRRRCEACQDSCSGYHPQSVVCPSASSGLDFPTFCQNCGCPACFHHVVQTSGALTEGRAQSITAFNIRQQDINFNATLAIFEIREEATASKNIAALTTLLRSEGLEVLSLENRALDAEEALFLRSRQLAVQERDLSEMVNQGFDGDKKRRQEQIRGGGGSESIFSAATRNDLERLDTAVRNQEQSIKKKAQRYLGNRRPQSQTQGDYDLKENSDLGNPMAQAPQRAETFAHLPRNDGDAARGGLGSTTMLDSLGQGLQAAVGARKRSHTFKVSSRSKSQRKLGAAVKRATARREQQSSIATSKLIQVVQSSKHISRLMGNRSLIVTVSSTSQSNLEVKLKRDIVPSFAHLAPPEQIFCTYISQNRIHAIEDSVLFAPQLYRLQKSIILSEPVSGLFKPARTYDKASMMRASDGGQKYVDKQMWYSDMQVLADEMKQLREKLAHLTVEEAGLPKSIQLRRRLEELEHEQSSMATRKPENYGTCQGAGIRGLDIGVHQASAAGQAMAATLGGQGRKKMTSLNRALTVSIRQRNFAATVNEGLGIEKEGGQIEKSQQIKDDSTIQKPREDSLWTAKDEDTNRIYKNYGTMLDFFDYSGVRVQDSIRLADLARPPSFGLQLRTDKDQRELWDQKVRQGSQGMTRSCNLFAVAKVGTPNMIFPSTLDVQMRNYQDHEQYYQLADLFFPSTAKSQFTVLIFRPLIVSNEMSDLFVEILKANDFLIIKRKRRPLTKPEASYLCKLEKVGKENIELYLDTVLSGPCEIVITSKVGAVQDAKTLCHGSETGRRRASLVDEGSDGTRQNVDSLSAMFEIAPFSSFNEFVDLEDFLVQHSRLKKYKKEAPVEEGKTQDRVVDALSIQKIEEIRLELSSFTRSFNMAAVAAPTEAEALKLISFVAPRVAQLEEVIFILNPLYADRRVAAEELLVRMQYRFVKTAVRVLNPEQAEHLFEDKYGGGEPAGRKLIDGLANTEVYIYHLTKLAGEREVRALFAQSDVILEDYLFTSAEITQARGSYLPNCLPYLFFYMDSGTMHERAVELLYGREYTTFTAKDLLQKFTKHDLQSIIETCLFTAVGDSILRVVYDEAGEIIPRSKLRLISEYQHGMMSGHNRPQQYVTTYPGQREDAQFQLMLSQTAQDDSSVRYIVEGDSHTVFEVRFHKISHRGDVSASSRFELEDVELDESPEPVRRTNEKRVRFDEADEDEGQKPPVQKEILHFFEKFQTLNFYYKQVNRQLGGGVAPNFYRFKLCPPDGPILNRVYEVEEHMGRVFLEEVAEMQRAHARQLQHAKAARGGGPDWQAGLAAIDKQKSLPAFILGRQIALMCKKLEKVQCQDQTQLEGAGALVYSQKEQALHGKVKKIGQFFQADKARFSSMLTSMRTRWFLYLSVLETEIIEAKLNFILESLTFKFTRQPELLSLIPDRLTEFNLRLASTVQVLNTDADDDKYGTRARRKDDNSASSVDNKRKFYKDVYEDPDRPANLRNVLESVMHAVNQPELATKSMQKETVKKDRDMYVNGKSSKTTKGGKECFYHEYQSKQQSSATQDDRPNSKYSPPKIPKEKELGYSIHKHVAVSGVEVAKRCKYQLVASVLYLVNFWLRKVNRRTELFADGKVDGRETEQQYDAVLDSIMKGIEENYGDDEINHVLDLVALRRGNDSKFEAVLREKVERQLQSQKLRTQMQQEKARRRRNDPSIPIVDLIRQERSGATEGDKQQFAQLQQFLDARCGDDKQLSGADGDQFKSLLEATKAKLGANAAKLAEEFVLKAQLDAERRAAGRAGIQEKLSFVKMEYFLYGFSDAHRLMQQLQKLGLVIKDMEAQVASCSQDELHLGRQLAQASHGSIGMSGGANPYIDQLPGQLRAQSKEIKTKIQNLEQKIDDARYQMAQRETELLIVFRELMTWDVFVPDHYFDGDRLLKQDKWASSATNDEFLVPIKTFWLPIALDDAVVDPNSTEGRDHYMLPVPDAYSSERGTFLPGAVHDAAKRHAAYEEQQSYAQTLATAGAEDATTRSNAGRASSRSGSTQRDAGGAPSRTTGFGIRPITQEQKKMSMLRQPEARQARPEHFAFPKLTNPSFQREAAHLGELSQTLRAKTAPGRDIAAASTGPREAHIDPFGHLRNKARSDELIQESIAHFMLHDATSSAAPGLSKQECRQLAQEAIIKMKVHAVSCDPFDELNFETSFRIYANNGMVDSNQLKNFVKSVAEL